MSLSLLWTGLSHITACSLVPGMSLNSSMPGWVASAFPQLGAAAQEMDSGTKAALLTPPLIAVLTSLLTQLHSLGLQGEPRAPFGRCCSPQTDKVPAVTSQSHRIGNRWMHRHRSTQGSNRDGAGQHTGGRSPHTDLRLQPRVLQLHLSLGDLKDDEL